MVKTEIPEQIGRYEVKGEFGEGAFSRVYEAEDPLVGRTVAIKVMKDPKLAPRLRAESHRLGQMTGHKHILNIHDAGVHHSSNGDGSLDYLVLEPCDSSLRKEIDNRKKDGSDWRKYVNLTLEALDGLQALHKKEIVHRDLKPENILLNKGSVRIGDFSLVTDDEVAQFNDSIMQSEIFDKSGSNQIMGTLAYMSPEQKRGQNVTPQANVYNMGQILSELLTGRRLDELGRNSSVSDFGADRWLDDILDKATAFLPEERYNSAGEMATDLRKGLAGAFDSPTISERITSIAKTAKDISWKATKLAGKALAFPIMVPVWGLQKADNLEMKGSDWATPIGVGSLFLGAALYTAAPITGLVQYEKHLERKTQAVAKQVFAEQPDSTHLVYRDGGEIKLAKLNTLLTDNSEPRTISGERKVTELFGEKEGKLYYLAKGDFSEEVPGSYREQVFRFDPKTGETEGLIDYTNPENNWLREKDIDGFQFSGFVKLGTSKLLKIEHRGSTQEYTISDNGHAFKRDDLRTLSIIGDDTKVPNSDLRIDSGGSYIQVWHKDDLWGDFEMFRGGYNPVLVNIPSE